MCRVDRRRGQRPAALKAELKRFGAAEKMSPTEFIVVTICRRRVRARFPRRGRGRVGRQSGSRARAAGVAGKPAVREKGCERKRERESQRGGGTAGLIYFPGRWRDARVEIMCCRRSTAAVTLKNGSGGA